MVAVAHMGWQELLPKEIATGDTVGIPHQSSGTRYRFFSRIQDSAFRFHMVI